MNDQRGKWCAWSYSGCNARLARIQLFPGRSDGNAVLFFLCPPGDGHISMFHSTFILFLILKGLYVVGTLYMFLFIYFLLSNVGHFVTVLFITNFLSFFFF